MAAGNKDFSELLKKLTLEKGNGNNAAVAKKLGFTPQRYFNYLNGRKPPHELYVKWKEIYGEDLNAMMNDLPVEKVNKPSTTGEMFQDKIFHGDYVGMHVKAWTAQEETRKLHAHLLKEANKNMKELVAQLASLAATIASIQAERKHRK